MGGGGWKINRRKFFIKIESLENGSDLKEVKIFDVNLDIDVADLTAKCVKRFCKLEEWRYALYHPQTRQWLYNGSSLRDYSLREWVQCKGKNIINSHGTLLLLLLLLLLLFAECPAAGGQDKRVL